MRTRVLIIATLLMAVLAESVCWGVDEPIAETASSAGSQIDTFLTASDMEPLGLICSQRATPDDQIQAWVSDVPDSVYERIVDIRWLFDSADEASKYHQDHLVELSENAPEIPAKDFDTFGEELRVFYRGADDPMIKAFGMDIQMYQFTFRVDRVLAKVHITGSGKMTAKDAARIGQLAHERIKSAPVFPVSGE